MLCVLALTTNNSTIVEAGVMSDMTCRSYVVMDSNNRILYEKNKDEKFEVASICKLMTLLLTFEEIDKGNLNLDDKILVSTYASNAEGSQAFLDAGHEYSLKDLIKSVVVASANDSAIVLAERVSGNEGYFVEKMNNKAKTLGMHNTMYSNSTGLNYKEQYSTAYDTAILLNEVSKYPIYQEYCKIWMDDLVHDSGRITELVNTNRLIKYYPYCVTGKTGFTDEAKYCLSSTALKDDLKLTCVVLGCDSSAERFTESVDLYNMAYANYINKSICKKGDIVENDVVVNKAKKEEVSLIVAEDIKITLDKNNQKYSTQYELPESIDGPIEIGDKVGEVLVISEGKILASSDIISNENIEKQSYKDIFIKILKDF